jgi:hypothetical protein
LTRSVPVRPLGACLLLWSLAVAGLGMPDRATADPVADPIESDHSEADRAGGDPGLAGLDYSRLALIGGSAAIVRHVGYRYFDRAWYQGEKRDSIRWLNDWAGDTYVNMDKGGHFMGGLFLSRSLTTTYTWTGFSPRKAAALGMLTSWAALLEVEMRDAYFDQWGFSVPDFAANTLGASVPLLHALVPSTRVIDFKFGFWPSSLYTDNEERRLAGRPHTDFIIDDYEGMTFWMTLAVNDVLPDRAEEVWPDFLGLALGYGASGLHGSNVKSRGRERAFKDLPDARPEILLSLDYDARYLPGKDLMWNHFKTQLNWIHFPAPAIRLYPDVRFYLLYL